MLYKTHPHPPIHFQMFSARSSLHDTMGVHNARADINDVYAWNFNVRDPLDHTISAYIEHITCELTKNAMLEERGIRTHDLKETRLRLW